MLGHLRAVKDPFRTALASRLLPRTSRLRVLHVGKALDQAMLRQAQIEMWDNPRYRWLGEVPRWRALRILAGSHVMVLSSLSEGGANVVSEALAVGVPIVASRSAGSIGLLGEDYPGYFLVQDTASLAFLLERVESDAGFHPTLSDWAKQLAPLVEPERELQTWAWLLQELP